MEINKLSNTLFERYRTYYQIGFEKKHFTHQKLIDHLQNNYTNKIFNIEILGKSFQNRDIYKIAVGNGDIKVLLWSQMHGDESTATRALLDVFNFFNNSNDDFDEIRELILNKLKLYFVPMLNPDGAEHWQRRTLQEIDMNRDALRNETIEGQLLQELYKSFNPDYAFNLHDQASYYTVGATANPATISLLAPPINDQDTITPNRRLSMQLVCALNDILQKYIPNCVGKWKDDYEPRAFGEHFQKLGAATLLIESGGKQNDNERQIVRKLNFIMLLSSFYLIASQKILQQDISNYKKIPVNVKEGIFDVIYKNVTIENGNKKYLCDVGLRQIEKLNNQNELISTFVIDDIGDLSVFGAFETIDVKEKEIITQNKLPIKIGQEANFVIKA